MRSEHSFVRLRLFRRVLKGALILLTTFRIVSSSCANSRDHAVVMPLSDVTGSHNPKDHNKSAGLALLLLNLREEPSAPLKLIWLEPISGGIAVES